MLFQATADGIHWEFYIMKNNLLDRLRELSQSDYYPYHMPGHKRNALPGQDVQKLDITEIDEFDNLFHAEGILRECMNRAGKLYGSRETFFSVNGSTAALLIAISAAFYPGDRVLVARNCHKAVYHALELRRLKPIFFYPERNEETDTFQGIKAEEVKAFLESSDQSGEAPVKGMILTSPTYEGLVSEISGIAALLHERGAVLIVDEAHGAHFGFHEAFPESSISQGADCVIQSLHKTLPSMTQTALLHLCSDRVEGDRIRKYTGIYQSSSPSYVLMASMDSCVAYLEEMGETLFRDFAYRLELFYKRMEALTFLRVYHEPGRDPGKVVITCKRKGMGKYLYTRLREEFHLQPECCQLHFVLMILTLCDTEEGFARLEEALLLLDKELAGRQWEEACEFPVFYGKTERVYYAYEAVEMPMEQVILGESAGCVSGEYLYLYPPGIPFLIPGEVISEELTSALSELTEAGYEIQGPADYTGKQIRIIREKTDK